MVKEIDFSDDLENALSDLFFELEPVQQTELMNKFSLLFIQKCDRIINKYINEDSLAEFKDNIVNSNIGEFTFLINAAFDNEAKLNPESSIMKKIKQVQICGGENFISAALLQINTYFNTINNITKDYKAKILIEEQEDISYRNKFSNDDNARIYNCDYSLIKDSRNLTIYFKESLDKQEAIIKKAQEFDQKIISELEKILREPKLKIITRGKGSEDKVTEFIPTLKIISNSNVTKLNEYLSELDFSSVKKKEAFEKFQQIPEWNELMISMGELKSLVEICYVEGDKMRALSKNTNDVDLSKLVKTNDMTSSIEEIQNKLLQAKEFRDIINTLENSSKGIETAKERIKLNCDALKKVIYEKNSFNQTEMILNKSLFNYKNQDVIDFKANLELTCEKFFEVSKLYKFSESFYIQQLSRSKNLEIQIVKFLIDRYIEKDAFMNKYNNKGIYNKTLGFSQRVSDLNYLLVKLEQDNVVDFTDVKNRITMLDSKFNYSKK